MQGLCEPISLCSLIFLSSQWLQGTPLRCLFLTLLFVHLCCTSQARLPQNLALRAHLRDRESSYVPPLSLSSVFPRHLWNFLVNYESGLEFCKVVAFLESTASYPLCQCPCLCIANVFMLAAKRAPFHLCALTFCLKVLQYISNYVGFASWYVVLLWTNLITNGITTTWLLAGVIYICSDSWDDLI